MFALTFTITIQYITLYDTMILAPTSTFKLTFTLYYIILDFEKKKSDLFLSSKPPDFPGTEGPFALERRMSFYRALSKSLLRTMAAERAVVPWPGSPGFPDKGH